MAEIDRPFQLTIRIIDAKETQHLHGLVREHTVELEDVRVERSAQQQDELLGVLGSISTALGAVRLTAKAVVQVRRLINEVVAAASDIPDEYVMVEIDGTFIPVVELTDQMLTTLLGG